MRGLGTNTSHVFWVSSFQMRFGAKLFHRYFPTFFKTSLFKTLGFFVLLSFVFKCHQSSVFSEKIQDASCSLVLASHLKGSVLGGQTTKDQLQLKSDNCFHACPQPGAQSCCDCGGHRTPSSPSTFYRPWGSRPPNSEHWDFILTFLWFPTLNLFSGEYSVPVVNNKDSQHRSWLSLSPTQNLFNQKMCA